ncbi:MAG: TFIIB-type zinc ribbon-containing protein [Planctomycetes bacterium]|nr:TFIIB-type zinc ribbon-containing protein [Planctomycetota bacterium]
MPIEVVCPECGNYYDVADSQAGRRVVCKDCGTPVQAPGVKSELRGELLVHPMSDSEATEVAFTRPYGASPTKARASKKQTDPSIRRKLNKVLIVGVALSALGFLLPWFVPPKAGYSRFKSEYGAFVLGVEIPFALNSRFGRSRDSFERRFPERENESRRIAKARAQLEDMDRAFTSLYSLLLIPLFALLTLLDEVLAARQDRNHWWYRLLFPLTPAFIFVYIYWMSSALESPSLGASNSNDGSDLPNIGFGFWIFVFGLLVSFISIFTSPKPKVEYAPKSVTLRTRPDLSSKPTLPAPRQPQ